jgi:hypothetical protein
MRECSAVILDYRRVPPVRGRSHVGCPLRVPLLRVRSLLAAAFNRSAGHESGSTPDVITPHTTASWYVRPPPPASALPRTSSWLYLGVSSFLDVPIPASVLTAPPGGATHATPTAACAHLPWSLTPVSTLSWSDPCTCRVTFSLPDPAAAWISAVRAGGVLVTAPSVPPVSSAAWRILLRAGGSLRRHRRFISARVSVRGILLGAGRGHTSHMVTEASGSWNPALTIRPAVSDGAGADGRVLVILQYDFFSFLSEIQFS